MFWILAFFLAQPAQAFPLTPDPQYTTGSLCTLQDPDFSEIRYHSGVVYCNRNVERELKIKIYDLYGIPERCRAEYTIDHLIPLSIGGSNHFNNLWPEHRKIKEQRLHLEEEVYVEVKSGTLMQEEAVRLILEAKKNPQAFDYFDSCMRN